MNPTELRAATTDLLKASLRITAELLRIMIPVIVVVKILNETGLVEMLGRLLAPLMRVVGLPGSMGLAWATAIVTNLYGGMAVIGALASTTPLSVAQVTVLAGMMLVAHNIPVETRIAQKAGTRLHTMLVLRLGGALALGWCLHWMYRLAGWGQAQASILWKAQPQNASIPAWAWGEAKNMLRIYLIILALLVLMKVLDKLGITRLLTRLLKPVLVMLGISPEAAPLTIVGMTLGLGFGGGLIIAEARSGRLTREDTFFALSLMGLSHSLIEDTLLMLAMGAALWGILWARLVFSLAVVFVLVKVVVSRPAVD